MCQSKEQKLEAKSGTDCRRASGLRSPGETVAAHGIAGGGAVALLQAVDERAVEAGLALLQAAVLLEAAAAAGHAPGILSVAKATFLEGLTGETHRLRGGGAGGEWRRGGGGVQLLRRT